MLFRSEQAEESVDEEVEDTIDQDDEKVVAQKEAETTTDLDAEKVANTEEAAATTDLDAEKVTDEERQDVEEELVYTDIPAEYPEGERFDQSQLLAQQNPGSDEDDDGYVNPGDTDKKDTDWFKVGTVGVVTVLFLWALAKIANII